MEKKEMLTAPLLVPMSNEVNNTRNTVHIIAQQ